MLSRLPRRSRDCRDELRGKRSARLVGCTGKCLHLHPSQAGVRASGDIIIINEG